MTDKLEQKRHRYMELSMWLSQPGAASDAQQWQQAMREQAALEETVQHYEQYLALSRELADAQELLTAESDADMREMARQEIALLEKKRAALEEALRLLLLPQDPRDQRNVVLEIRAGTGGDEAALFAGDLFRMYTAYAQARGWAIEPMALNQTEIGGIKEAVVVLTGKNAFQRLKYESGVHRVQRVPATESSGRIHTSAATVAVLPEAQDVDVDIQPSDLRIDIYRSSGAGGQHVNTTDSAVRMTHIPTGIVVACQDERSQIKNREKAMRLLKSRVYDHYQQIQQQDYASSRRGQIGSGDRSERIRTYNFSQNRVTDHRIGLTLYQLDSFLDGDCDEMIDALLIADRNERLASQSS